MRIRPLAANEWRLIRPLRLRALATDPSAFGSTVSREETFPDDEWRARWTPSDTRATFVAQDEAEAWVALASVWFPPEKPDPEVWGMWVAPEARGAGVGRALLDAAVAWAHERGAARVALWVNAENESAMRLYERAGFARVGEPSQESGGQLRLFQQMARDV